MLTELADRVQELVPAFSVHNMRVAFSFELRFAFVRSVDGLTLTPDSHDLGL